MTFSSQQPMLWSVIFKYHLELQHHNEAYAAIVHNPDKARRENCLRHFIITLCDRGLFHEICTYPYVNLQEEVCVGKDCDSKALLLIFYLVY